MKALDTNVLVRYLVQDDLDQARRATLFIEQTAAAGEQLLIDAVVLCELVWVLDAAYGYRKDSLVDAIEAVLLTAQFHVDEKDVAWAALADYKNSRADFADCLIGRVNQSRGSETTVTFDKSLKTLPTFELLR